MGVLICSTLKTFAYCTACFNYCSFRHYKALNAEVSTIAQQLTNDFNDDLHFKKCGKKNQDNLIPSSLAGFA